MAATVTKDGPYFASGQISFSSLRTNFKETSSGSISASELKRNTSVTNKNPIVPDATENAGISSGNNLAISQFRNSIKYYYITQTGTDTNFDIGAQSWNSNLNKNILKRMYTNGTVGSSTLSAAAILSSTAHNLTIDVSGSILGSGGGGGGTAGAPAISGQKGGDALEIGYQNISVSQTYNTISGVSSNLLSLDVYYNSDTSIVKPVVIYIHGGGLALGDKSAVHSKATFFNNLGYVFVSVNYRLSPAANLVKPYNFFVGDNGTTATASTRVKHTNHVTDCANAVTWVYNNISSYGGNNNKLVLIGHSAGAILASLLVTNQSYLTAAGLPAGKILGCISNDTESYNILQQILTPIVNEDVPNPSPITIQKTVMNAFGIYPDKTVTGTINNITTDFATKAAAEAVYATGSAILNISASTPPFLVLRRGAPERIARETEFVTALQNAGKTVTAVSYPNNTTYTHAEINESIGAPNDPPVGKTLPAGVSNVSTVIQNWITNLVPPAPALTSNNVVVFVRNAANIYGGGGGGERGKTGDDGAPGTCTESDKTQGCGSKPSCESGFTETGTWEGRCCESYSYCCGLFNCACEACSKYLQGRYCEKITTMNGGSGGLGGVGGKGRGYDNQNGSISGGDGLPGSGSPSPCSGTQSPAPGIGKPGKKGGDGGNYGESGQSTPNTGDGGAAGRAISGSNYSVTGTLNTNTIKGLYNP